MFQNDNDNIARVHSGCISSEPRMVRFSRRRFRRPRFSCDLHILQSYCPKTCANGFFHGRQQALTNRHQSLVGHAWYPVPSHSIRRIIQFGRLAGNAVITGHMRRYQPAVVGHKRHEPRHLHGSDRQTRLPNSQAQRLTLKTSLSRFIAGGRRVPRDAGNSTRPFKRKINPCRRAKLQQVGPVG